MGFKSKATKINKAKKEARVKPVKRSCSGHIWKGVATHQHVREWGKTGSCGKGQGHQKIGQLNANFKGDPWSKGLNPQKDPATEISYTDKPPPGPLPCI